MSKSEREIKGREAQKTSGGERESLVRVYEIIHARRVRAGRRDETRAARGEEEAKKRREQYVRYPNAFALLLFFFACTCANSFAF